MSALDPFVGEIIMVPFNFAPKNFAFCDGQLLPISQNISLFSILGTYYGGDGKSTFALPDMQGRVPIGAGQGPDLTQRELGEMGGANENQLTINQMPVHTHLIKRRPLSLPAGENNNTNNPINNYPGIAPSGLPYGKTAGTGTMADLRSRMRAAGAGGNTPVNNCQPTLTIMFAISMAGVFPPRQ
ncbi:microcystin-dependent protein [Chitinophaga sp. W3I9]|uniref:phage tail protein n=1 Tax=unclassified Chitinophaga TaxID=2619133 RepID=UPI003D1F8299